MNDHSDNLEKIDLEQGEEREIRELEGLRAPVIYEIIRREGKEELDRPSFSLAISGLAAGLAIGFSVVGESVLHAYLPDAPWRHLVEGFGYTVGFLIIIMARLQLFTENTITPVLPFLLNPSKKSVTRLLRLWSIVLAANVLGCFIFAAAISSPGALPSEVYEAGLSISRHMMENSRWEMFFRGIFSGWLIASMVWMIPTAETAKFWIIVLITYIIAAGSFTHIVAGSVEAFLLVINDELSMYAMMVDFFGPVLVGNVIGGSVVFSMLCYGQVSHEA